MSRLFPILLAISLSLSLTFPFDSYGRQKQDEKKEYVRFKGIDVDSLVKTVCTEHGASRVGGIWSATTDGATVGIVPAEGWIRTTGMTIPDMERTLAERWMIILLDSPNPILQPGTLMGWFTPTAKPDHFNAYIYTKRDNTRLSSPRRFILHLADDGHMTMKAVRKGIEINPWRFLPYMIRGSVRYRDESPRDIDGFLKKWPVPHNPQNPRYL